LRNANRRKDTYMQRVFTVMRSSQDPKVLVFGVDSEESLENHGRVGEVLRGLDTRGVTRLAAGYHPHVGSTPGDYRHPHQESLYK
jgi:hypothetical protein